MNFLCKSCAFSFCWVFCLSLLICRTSLLALCLFDELPLSSANLCLSFFLHFHDQKFLTLTPFNLSIFPLCLEISGAFQKKSFNFCKVKHVYFLIIFKGLSYFAFAFTWRSASSLNLYVSHKIGDMFSFLFYCVDTQLYQPHLLEITAEAANQ